MRPLRRRISSCKDQRDWHPSAMTRRPETRLLSRKTLLNQKSKPYRPNSQRSIVHCMHTRPRGTYVQHIQLVLLSYLQLKVFILVDPKMIIQHFTELMNDKTMTAFWRLLTVPQVIIIRTDLWWFVQCSRSTSPHYSPGYENHHRTGHDGIIQSEWIIIVLLPLLLLSALLWPCLTCSSFPLHPLPILEYHQKTLPHWSWRFWRQYTQIQWAKECKCSIN